jgi:hypothetical protein
MLAIPCLPLDWAGRGIVLVKPLPDESPNSSDTKLWFALFRRVADAKRRPHRVEECGWPLWKNDSPQACASPYEATIYVA